MSDGAMVIGTFAAWLVAMALIALFWWPLLVYSFQYWFGQ